MPLLWLIAASHPLHHHPSSAGGGLIIGGAFLALLLIAIARSDRVSVSPHTRKRPGS